MNQLHHSTHEYPLEQYEICVKGHLDQRWSDWFEGFAIALTDNGETQLSGPVVDQAALYGLLIKVRDLGLPLVSVNSTQANEQNSQTGKQENTHEFAEADIDDRDESHALDPVDVLSLQRHLSRYPRIY